MLHMFAYEYASKSAHLSPLGWPCIYSRCSTSWIATRIHSHWMGFSCSVSDSVMDLERAVFSG